MEMEITPIAETVVRVAFAGRLDSPAVDRLETRFLAALVPNGNNAVVDLTGVDFIASMGLRMLVSTARSLKMKHAKLALFGATSGVRQVFDTVALHKIIPICSTEAEALAAVAPVAD